MASVGMLLSVGCSTIQPSLNKPTTQLSAYNRFASANTKTSSNELMLVLSFSGGGTRAAALSYGVLKALNETKVNLSGQHKTLLSEVDIISSVSGGSFTAAYFGLFGEKIFKDYEQDFLRRKIQNHILNRWLFSPSNWSKLASENYNRTDLAVDYYDKHIFKGKTFADMRDDAPQIIINTTDIATGNSFAFTPENMRYICSDLSGFPVARAVAASSAVPGVFSPIPLKNYDGCELYPYQKATVTKERHIDYLAINKTKYLDKVNYPYLHLVDGGISDNLGVRSILRATASQNDHFPTVMKTYGLQKTKKVVFLIVNAADDISPHIALTKTEPSIEDTIGAVTTLQSRNYNYDTLDLLDFQFNKWSQQLEQNNCTEQNSHCEKVKFYKIELNLNQLPKILAKETSLYATALQLPDEQVDTLIESGEYLLRTSEEFSTLLADLQKANDHQP